MDIITYALSKKYTEKMADSLGSLKGAPCTIKKVTEKDNGVDITFEWIGKSGASETTTIFIKNGLDGEQGNGIAKIEKIKTVDLVDTYRMTFDDGSIFEYEVTNGSNSTGGASTWSEVNDKPFETISSDFAVVDNELKLADGVAGKIDAIKVNGIELPIVNKTIDIEIPEYIYIGNTEPTDENVLLWVNPDETSSNLEVAISKAEGNVLEQKQDGLYVAEGAIKISKEESNIIEQKSDGIFAAIDSKDEKTVNTILDIVKNNVETEDLNFSVFFN